MDSIQGVFRIRYQPIDDCALSREIKFSGELIRPGIPGARCEYMLMLPA